MARAGFPLSRKDVQKMAFSFAIKKEIKGFSTSKKTAGYY